jgi:PIN domain
MSRRLHLYFHPGMPIQKLLFIDTNVWLDFYRVRNEVGLSLLAHSEAVADRVIVTFQLESEFKKNRQVAILDGLKELKSLSAMARPGIFSDAKAVEVINRGLKKANKRIAGLRLRLTRVLDNPALHDPVYKACQRIFHKKDPLVLTRENKIRYAIRRKAFRRFLHGCPPRKPGDTSIGDAFNWEWMIHCANQNNAELVIVSRDQDYGIEFDKKVYINDHLRQEFSERVSKKRKLLLYTRLSEALKHFEVQVTAEEEAVETEFITATRDVDIAASLNSSAVRSKSNADLMEALEAALRGDLRKGSSSLRNLRGLSLAIEEPSSEN